MIIPAFNEEKVIIQTINSILKSDYSNLEIIVVDDGSHDSTYVLTWTEFLDNSKVFVYSKENGGKSNALNFGITKTDADIFVTLDVDTIFKKNTISKLIRKFSDEKIGAVAGNAKVGNRNNILTKWQALEYITSQNLDKRAFEMINCITVVPGAIGAWRRDAVISAEGFSDQTLAEDADLTFGIIRLGYRVIYEDEAVAFTEAPDTIKNFIKQRFRWMFGTFQVVWKHRGIFGKRKYGNLGFFAIPNVLIFQILFPLISPIMDLMIVLSAGWAIWQEYSHPEIFSFTNSFNRILIFYLFFLIMDLITSSIPFLLEKKEDWRLIIWMPFQRFYYIIGN